MTGIPALRLAGVYRRRVNASLARIWENVFDWEHLAHLHQDSFADCALLETSDGGWRVVLTPKGAAPQTIEMRADRGANRYVTTTIAGVGIGSEIRVALAPVAEEVVEVAVEFHLPEPDPDRLTALGEAYAAVYARLWDEDEAMMRAREQGLARRVTARRNTPPLDLGAEATVRAQLPLAFVFGEAPFRLVEVDGALIAHSTICPHWLGPLDAAPVIGGDIRCPWHGYAFDVKSGRCVAHPESRLAPAPAIRIVDGQVLAIQE